MTVAAAEKYNMPNEFVTLLGYEWAAEGCHKNVYYREGDMQEFAGSFPDTSTKAKHLEFMEQYECIVIPHHPKFMGEPIWEPNNPDLEKLAEICSVWGLSEEGNECAVLPALDNGLRFGFIAGTDNHQGRMGLGNSHWGNEDGGSGIACVIAPALTREAIYDALKGRRCYATTGARILMDFRINGKMMGSEIRLRVGEKRRITSLVIGGHEIIKAELVKDSCVVFSESPGTLQWELDWDDPETDTTAGADGDYYYIRVQQSDGHRAWSSPIFLEVV
jgi:hypothetical protein